MFDAASVVRPSRLAALAGVLLVTGLGMLDATTSLVLIGGLAIGPFATAVLASPRGVLAVGVYALTWIAFLGADGHWNRTHWLRFALVLTGTLLGVAAAALRQRYVHALVRTTHVAEVAQHALLRPLPETIEGAEVAVRYISASEGALIGGDVYDVATTPWGLRVLVADVSGKGLEAVDHAAVLLSAFREGAFSCDRLEDLAEVIDTSFQRRVGTPVEFATGILLEMVDSQVKIVNCGHPDPLLVRAARAVWMKPAARCRPFGLAPSPRADRFVLMTGERLVLYTDGLIETRDRRGEFFDLATHAVETLRSGPLDAGIDALLGRLRRHGGKRLRDDVVILVLEAT